MRSSGDWRRCLTVGHDKVFVKRRNEIDVFELNGTPVCSFGERTLSDVGDIAAGSDGQIFVLEGRLAARNNHMVTVKVFTKRGHEQNEFRVGSTEDVYFSMACYPLGEHIILADLELTTNRRKVAIYHKDGVTSIDHLHLAKGFAIVLCGLQSPMMVASVFPLTVTKTKER